MDAFVCLAVNEEETNRARCIKRLAILFAQTYQWTPIARQKPVQSGLPYASKFPAEKVDVNRHFKPAEPHSPWDACFSFRLIFSSYLTNGRVSWQSSWIILKLSIISDISMPPPVRVDYVNSVREQKVGLLIFDCTDSSVNWNSLTCHFLLHFECRKDG